MVRYENDVLAGEGTLDHEVRCMDQLDEGTVDQPVLRIRIRDPLPFDPWIRDG